MPNPATFRVQDSPATPLQTLSIYLSPYNNDKYDIWYSGLDNTRRREEACYSCSEDAGFDDSCGFAKAGPSPGAVVLLDGTVDGEMLQGVLGLYLAYG